MIGKPYIGCLRRGASILLMLPIATPGLAQKLGQGQGDDISILRIILVLLLCLGLAAGAAFVLRARMGHAPIAWRLKHPKRRLELRDSLRLPNQVDLSIIRCDGEELLVATSSKGLIVVKDSWKGQPVGETDQQ